MLFGFNLIIRKFTQQDAHVQFKTQQYHHGIEPHPNHESHQRTYRTVDLVIIDKVVDQKEENNGCNNT
jgi:hypothetical protein